MLVPPSNLYWRPVLGLRRVQPDLLALNVELLQDVLLEALVPAKARQDVTPLIVLISRLAALTISVFAACSGSSCCECPSCRRSWRTPAPRRSRRSRWAGCGTADCSGSRRNWRIKCGKCTDLLSSAIFASHLLRQLCSRCFKLWCALIC